jgi:diadenosine tetraphosphate (Ap4A) HIT family hydrolase
MMSLTQHLIVLVGDDQTTEKVIQVVKGFKAVTVIKQLSTAAIANVLWHNKNAVYRTREILDMKTIKHYSPIILSCIPGESDFTHNQLGTTNIVEDFQAMLDRLNVDVGDHVMHDSCNSQEVMDNCFICKLVEGNPIRQEHILYESENFLVIPGVGAFFPGYTMIVPKRHVMSFAELDYEEFDEFLRVLNDMKFILKNVYHTDNIFAFECGSGQGGAGKHKTSIVHAHFHLAVTDMPVLECVHASGLNPALIDPEELIQDYGKYPYMLYVDQDDNWYITSDPETYFPRQHPRQILADYMGLQKGEYNWRTHPHEEKLDEIADEIYSFLRSEFNRLPAWIREATKKYLYVH